MTFPESEDQFPESEDQMLRAPFLKWKVYDNFQLHLEELMGATFQKNVHMVVMKHVRSTIRERA